MSLKTCTEQGSPAAPVFSRGNFVSIFFRSFFIQAGWNYERFQNLGFAFAITPALKKIYAPGPALNSAVLRHLGQFNTQPYMAGFVLGNTVKMEETFSRGPGGAGLEKSMLGVKSALASGFAAIGDRVFWGRLKPLTTQICIVVWLLTGFYGWLFTGTEFRPSMAALFGGPLAGMAVYGAFAVYLRWTGLKRGYACGGGSNCGLDALNWPGLIRALSVTGFAFSLLIVLAAFGLLVVCGWPGESGAGLVIKAAPVLAVMVLQRVTRKFGRSIFFAMGIVLAVSAVLFAFSGPGGWGMRI
jgi:mannose/fructose/N-acetylgalactosamine-specific phosphotransferase system component IID